MRAKRVNNVDEVEHGITDKNIISSLMSNADGGENDKDAVEESNVQPSQLTTEELEEAISYISRTALCSSEHGLEIRTLALIFLKRLKP